MKSYNHTYDSGILSFGLIPRHWNVNRLKWTTQHSQNGVWGVEPDGKNDTICIRVADFNRTKFKVNTDKLTYRLIDEDDVKQKALMPGDLLIEKSGGGESQLVGMVVLFSLDKKCVSSNFIASLRPDTGFNSRYLTYLHAHLYTSKVNYRSIKQTTGIQNLDIQQYLDELIAYPVDVSEQTSIAAFLDYKTTQIDNLIAEKEKLLRLLDEKRIATIIKAVTKGLNFNVKTKPTGIDWIGEIPEHWEVKPLFVQLDEVDNRNHDELEKNVLSLSYGTIISKDVTDNFGLLPESFSSYNIIEKNDIVLRLTDLQNDKKSLRVGIAREKGIITSAYVTLRNINSFTSNYLAFLLKSYDFLKVFYNYGGGVRQSMRFDDLKRLPIILPPPNEQIQIVKNINIQEKEYITLINLLKKGILTLKEYKYALISRAVTGKIDVRNFREEIN